MKQDLKKRWMIFSLIWAGALIVTFWNAAEIDEIIQAGQANERFRMNNEFIKNSSNKISEVLNKSKRLYHNTESLNMGLLFVGIQLEDLASGYGFKNFQIKNNKTETPGGAVSILLYFRGSLENGILFLKALKNDYPYLPVKKVLISVNKPEQLVQFNISLHYRYKISFQGSEG